MQILHLASLIRKFPLKKYEYECGYSFVIYISVFFYEWRANWGKNMGVFLCCDLWYPVNSWKSLCTAALVACCWPWWVPAFLHKDSDFFVKCCAFLQNEVNAIKWDPSGMLLASCSDDMTLKVMLVPKGMRWLILCKSFYVTQPFTP